MKKRKAFMILFGAALFAGISCLLAYSGQTISKTEGFMVYALCYLCSCKLMED